MTTDIVGYPTFGNFNVDLYYWMYALTAVAVPLVALVVYLALTRYATGGWGPWGRAGRGPVPVEEAPPVTGWRVPAVAAGRTLFIGAVLGLEVAIATDAREGTTVLVMVAYAAFVGLAAYAFTLGRDVVGVSRTLNVLATPLAVGGLYLVSSSTKVTVGSTGTVHEYPWLPAWLALTAVAVLYAIAAALLMRPRAGLTRERLERAVVVLVVAPVALFLLLSTVPGSLGAIDYFEEGQLLAGAELTRGGAFPWRDLLLAHGLLQDVFSGLFGFEVIEDSRWGMVAGDRLVLTPLAWVGVYYLCAFLFGGNWVFLAGTQALVVTGHLASVQIRFLLLPAVLLLLGASLRRASVVRVTSFTIALGAQVIVTPEALPLALAAFGTVVVYDAYHYERGGRLSTAFRRTLLVLASGAVLVAAWCVFLASHGALDDWLFSYRAFIPGHRYTGGIPVERAVLESFEAWAPVLALLAGFALAVALVHGRRRLATSDWVILAAAGLTFLYYVKFVSRADPGHLNQVFAVATPLVLYVAYRWIVSLEAWLARRFPVPSRHTVTLPLLVLLLMTAPTSPLDVAQAASMRHSAVVEREPEIERVGYDLASENDEALIAEVGEAVTDRLEPGDTIFDFSNSPGLFHYLHGLPASTRYYTVGLALRLRTQSDLLEQLERARPALVVYSSRDVGLSGWDGIANQVRHYEVSEYLLDNYVPVLESHGFVLMQRRSAAARVDPELYFRVGVCDWGYVPAFFAPAPSATAQTVSLSVGAPEAGRWTLTLPADAREYRWLEIVASTPLRGARFELADRLALTPEEMLASQVRGAVENGVLTPLQGARAVSSIPTRRVAFSTLGRDETTVRVRIGSCSQWRGYRSRMLHLTSTAPQDIERVRLVR